MILGATALDQPLLVALQECDPVVQDYRAFFALLDWTPVTERAAVRPWPGPLPHPWAAYIKALLVKIGEGKPFVTQVRSFLVKHPLLVLELGFRPVADPTAPYGFNVEKTVPSARWLRHQQQTLPAPLLRALFAGTVAALQGEIPHLGETIAYDVKHIYAWVQENNPKAFVAHRFDPARDPSGDPDCSLGVKRRGNQEGADGATTGPAELLWGYGTGVATTTSPRYGDVIVAEFTQGFAANDITYFRPLHARTVAALGRVPPNLTADAAFDAWYVYEAAAPGGVAAIPLNLRGQAAPNRDEAGRPRCTQGLAMVPRGGFAHEDGYPAQRFGCPLLSAHASGRTCTDAHFAKGGCTRVINLSRGGTMRVELDRQSPEYAAIYRQRTSAERINSQAKALGIERPMARNAHAVQRLNTLIYIVINVRALQRARQINTPEVPAA